jgi:hypothetical protein
MMMMMMMMNLQPSISFKNKVILIEHLGAKYTGPAFLSPLPSNRFFVSATHHACRRSIVFSRLNPYLSKGF